MVLELADGKGNCGSGKGAIRVGLGSCKDVVKRVGRNCALRWGRMPRSGREAEGRPGAGRMEGE